MKILSINAGSSSMKFTAYEMPEEKVLMSGLIERIGINDGFYTIKYNGEKETTNVDVVDHKQAFEIVVDELMKHNVVSSLDEVSALGHRVVQGGAYFDKSVLVDDDVLDKIEELAPLAPLHNPAALVGIRAAMEVFKDAKQVVVFDTAFHQTMEPQDYVFPIPYELTEKYDIRRYGAHGTSHKYLAQRSFEYLKGVEHPRVISCHIGSGASITAIKDGKCVATSMGLTPLGGIMMGTRTGDMDPSVFNYVVTVTGKSAEEVYQMFNKKSGFLGVSGISNDSRDVLAAAEAGEPHAILANDIFNRRIADYIGQYFVRLGGCDLIIFSAGIGENEPRTRRDVAHLLEEALGVKIDEELNKSIHGKEALISVPESKIKVAVIPTDEEVMIARDAYNMCIKG